jgi:hypothetical protein
VERAHILRGEKNGRVVPAGRSRGRAGHRVDLERRQIDLGLTAILESVRRRSRTAVRGRAASSRSRRAASGSPAQRSGRRPQRAAGRRGSVGSPFPCTPSSSAPPGISITARARWSAR